MRVSSTQLRGSAGIAAAIAGLVLAGVNCLGIAVVDAPSPMDDGGGASTSTTTSSTTGVCDVGDCSTCVLSGCIQPLCWAELNSAPTALIFCIANCEPPNPACVELCRAEHRPAPKYEEKAEHAYNCVLCDACYGDCGGEQVCPFEL